MTACTDERVKTQDEGPNHNGAYGLRPIEDCPDLERAIRAQMAARMNEEIDANLESALDWLEHKDVYCECLYGVWNQECAELNGRWTNIAGAGYYPPSYDDATDTNTTGAEEADGATEYSTTNTQVAGVDEADFVKNDGSYVYVVAGHELLILDAWPAPATHLLARAEIEGTPTRLFVEADHAVVYSDIGQGGHCAWDAWGGYQAGRELKITVFDITDRSAPWLDREIMINGTYANSRRIGSVVHTVVTLPQTEAILFETWPEGLKLWACDGGLTAAELITQFELLRQHNLELIAAATIGDFLPSAIDIDYFPGGGSSTDKGLFVDCEGFYEPPTVSAPGYLSVVSFDLEDDTSLAGTTVLGRAGDVYASHHALYVAVKDYNPYGGNGSSETTMVHKFSIDNTSASAHYLTSGAVPGRLINQFAMDEYNGDLRVATTEGHLPSPDCTNNVFVLRETACGFGVDVGEVVAPVDCQSVVASKPRPAVLAPIGAIRGIAPTEDIRSVRFDGPRGFMVTFKKTDPLFSFDLTIPTAPRVTGELKIPGFSTYMHFMDADHLLTIGFDAEDHGSFAYFQGIMLQIFDVSDPANMSLVHREIIGTRGTTSEATDDHMAFNYFPNRDLLAIPMGICEDSGGGGSYGTRMTFNGLLVYRVTTEEGFLLIGGVDHRDPAIDYTDYNCSNWWTTSNSQVKRSIFMEDYVYSISPELLKVNAVSALDAELASIPLPESETSNIACYDYH
jgi:hypothetical protein